MLRVAGRDSPLYVAHNAAGRDGFLHPASVSRAVRSLRCIRRWAKASTWSSEKTNHLPNKRSHLLRVYTGRLYVCVVPGGLRTLAVMLLLTAVRGPVERLVVGWGLEIGEGIGFVMRPSDAVVAWASGDRERRMSDVVGRAGKIYEGVASPRHADFTSSGSIWSGPRAISDIRQFVQLGRKFTGCIWLKIHADNELTTEFSRFLDEEF